jgi:opacity protein-like surface antigen
MSKTPRRPYRYLFTLVLTMTLFVSGPLRADSVRNSFGLGLGLGYRFMSSEVFRDLYGSTNLPLHISVQVSLGKTFGLETGLRLLRREGRTETIGLGVEPQEYGLHFRMMTFPFLGKVRARWGKAGLFFGLGPVINRYRETWDEMDIDVKGWKSGFLVTAGLDYFLSEHFAVRGSAEYSTLPTGRESVLAGSVNLGGFETVFGLNYHFLP